MSNPIYLAPDNTTQTAAAYKAALDASLAATGLEVINIGSTLSAGTFTVHGADGTALSSANPGFIRFIDKDNFGRTKYISVEANQSFIDDSGASTITGNRFGNSTGVADTADVVFFLYGVANDAMDTVQFMWSRDLDANVAPAAANIGAPDDAVADATDDFFSLTTGIDETLYNGNPCTRVLKNRMRMSASDDWTVQTPDATDGVGKFDDAFISAAGEWVQLTSTDISAAATVDFTLDSAYSDFKVVYDNILPVTNNVPVRFKLSADGGSTFIAGSAYSFSMRDGALSQAAYDVQSSSSISLMNESTGYNQGNNAYDGAHGEVFIHAALDASTYTKIRWFTNHGYAGDAAYVLGSGTEKTTQVTDAIRFYYSSGNMASGNLTIYGRKST
jgi:hypothetical protein